MIKLNAAQAKAMGVWTPRKPRKRSGKAKVTKSSPSLFQAACVAQGLPEPVPEFQFDPERRWRFDFAWVNEDGDELWEYRFSGGIALEIEGGAWIRGRHQRGKGFLDDMEKYNRAGIMHWLVLRCTPQDVKTGKVFELLREVLL